MALSAVNARVVACDLVLELAFQVVYVLFVNVYHQTGSWFKLQAQVPLLDLVYSDKYMHTSITALQKQ